MSGIDSTSRLNRCHQSMLRPSLRPAGGGGIFGSPSSQSSTDVMVELLVPQQPGIGLARDGPRLWLQALGNDLPIEGVRFRDALLEDLIEAGIEGITDALGFRIESKLDLRLSVAADLQAVVRGRLCAPALVTDCRLVTLDHVLVEGVLHIGRVVRHVEEPQRVRLILCEQHWRLVARRVRPDGEQEPAERLMLGPQRRGVDRLDVRLGRAILVLAAPDPGVAKPQRRQQVQEPLAAASIAAR